MLFGLQKAIRLTAGMDLLQFALESWKDEPEMRIEDAYKWLFHATLGGEHALTSLEGPTGWLEREWATLAAPFDHEPKAVSLRRDGGLVRLNLRPYRAGGGEKEALLDAFVRSAKSFKAEREQFASVWRMLGIRLQTGILGILNHEDWRELEDLTLEKAYPAIDHSPHYLKMKKPAYRVLTRIEADRLLNG